MFNVNSWKILFHLYYFLLIYIYIYIYISKKYFDSLFSNGARIPHQSRLLQDNVEALMCLQDWL